MKLRDKLKSAGDFLLGLESFISQDDALVIKSWETRFQHKWIDEVLSKNKDQHYYFDGLREYELLEDQNFLDVIQGIKYLSNCPSVKNHSSFEGFIPGKNKKQYELRQLYNLFFQDQGKVFVDFGGGVGNTSAFFNNYLKSSSLVIEQDKDLIEAGKRKFRGQLDYLHSKVDKDFDTAKIKNCDIALGLHTCGNFAHHMMDKSMDAHISKIVNFGCCYSKIEGQCYNHSKSANTKVHLNRRALSLGTLSFSEVERELYEFRLRILDYKYTFYHFMFAEYGDFEFLPMSNSRRSLYKLDFNEFFQKTMNRFYPEKLLPSSKRIMSFYMSPSNQKLLKYFKAYYALGRYFGELVESYLLLDRACFGEDRGYHADLLEVFNSKISPRNKAVILIRQ